MNRFGLLGQHLGHSYSPQLHALLGNGDYGLFEVEPQSLGAFLQNTDFLGCNVTIPYKRAVLPYCAVLSDAARESGSVNTLVRRADGSLFGDNTDIDGFRALLRAVGGIRAGEEAVVLGTGGAAQAVRFVLREAGANCVFISRSGKDNYETLSRHKSAVLLVNATPVGMYPKARACPADLSGLPALRAVIDLIYNPARTRLLLRAQERGLAAVGGLGMLVTQAAAAHERFGFGQTPQSRQDEIHRILARQMQNIVLIGMPASGKTTVGRALAAKLGREFFDSDGEFTARFGQTPAQFIETHGEAPFRDAETAILQDLCAKRNCVIATGGGCVTRRENDDLLRANARVVWLRRDLSLLSTAQRPISRRDGLDALWQARRGHYARLCDLCADNNGSISAAVSEILEGL